MLYPNGDEIRVGDILETESGDDGLVVCSLDAQEYSAEYRRSDWEYLRQGILVYSATSGLVHYIDPEPTFRLKRRVLV